jgi:hypothetical protein
MNNLETMVTMSTQVTVRGQTKQKTQKKKPDEKTYLTLACVKYWDIVN